MLTSCLLLHLSHPFLPRYIHSTQIWWVHYVMALISTVIRGCYSRIYILHGSVVHPVVFVNKPPSSPHTPISPSPPLTYIPCVYIFCSVCSHCVVYHIHLPQPICFFDTYNEIEAHHFHFKWCLVCGFGGCFISCAWVNLKVWLNTMSTMKLKTDL